MGYVSSVWRDDYIPNFTCASDNVKLSRIRQFLPTYSELENLSNGFADLASFEKVVSRCSQYSSRDQLFPVFIIPGLHSNRLLPLIKKLMYPVFCAKVPSKYSSAKNIAQSLIKVKTQSRTLAFIVDAALPSALNKFPFSISAPKRHSTRWSVHVGRGNVEWRNSHGINLVAGRKLRGSSSANSARRNT